MADPINFAKIAADLDTNPKVRRAGRNGREVFCFVLRRVAVMRAQGFIPVTNVDTWYLADQLQMTEAEADEGLAACLRPFGDTPGLLRIAGGQVHVCGWNNEWGRQPMTEAERKKKQRAEEKAELEAAKSAVDPDSPVDVTTCPDTSRDVVTSHACHGSDQIRSDEIRLEVPDLCVGGDHETLVNVVRTPAPHTQPNASPMPEGWAPDPTDGNTLAALEASRLGVVVDFELGKFRAWSRADSVVACDWNAKWRWWLQQAFPTKAEVRDAIARRNHQDTSKAALERERAEQRELRQRADTDRAENLRVAKAALDNNFRLPAEKATG